MRGALDLLGLVLVVVGVGFLSLGAYGMLRLPDTYTKAHAVSKTVVLGLLILLAAAATSGEPQVVARVILIGVVLLVAAPVVSHVVGRAAYEGEHAPGPGPEQDRPPDGRPPS